MPFLSKYNKHVVCDTYCIRHPEITNFVRYGDGGGSQIAGRYVIQIGSRD